MKTANLYGIGLALSVLCAGLAPAAADVGAREMLGLRLAVEDLAATYGARYPGGAGFLRRLAALERAEGLAPAERERRFRELQQEALLANPLLDGSLLLVKRRAHGPNDLGFPTNHECNTSLPRQGYDNEFDVLSPIRPEGRLTPLYRPPDGGYVGELDLRWDAGRLLFTQSDRESWKVWEMSPDGTALRQVSRAPGDVDSFDACYLPDGGIAFGSTASWQAVPCWHGLKRVTNLYRMNADGTGMRQLCFDQDHDFHPCVLPNGQVLYHRWDYTGICHVFMRQLMVMNPDGTGQRAIYGSNSWFPNALYFPRPLPGDSGKLVAVLSGYHGVPRMGQLVVVDPGRGWFEADGLAQRISGRGEPIRPLVKDQLVDADWPKFLTPYPLSEKHFLVSAWLEQKGAWGIYLADVFDNLVLVREEPGWALLEPLPLRATPRPPAIRDQVDPRRKDATVYLHNVTAGPGLRGVPPGTVKSLRVLAYDFAYPGLAGPDLVGRGGPWEVMRILGTVPLGADGSAMFRVPACTPIAVQPLDEEGRAVQLMRSWFTAMPGETLSCVGCHESPATAAPGRPALAAQRMPVEITPWRGPARGFSFTREVQPVLDRYCLACHGAGGARPDLRADVPGYRGLLLSKLGVDRMHPLMLRDTGGFVRYSPSYEALLPYIRRVGIEDDVSLLLPGEYHADTSPLIQMLRKGHGGVRLDAEAWDRLVTWIDLNAPCHGTWGEVYPIPDGAHERRMALRAPYGGPAEDPEAGGRWSVISSQWAGGSVAQSNSRSVGQSDRLGSGPVGQSGSLPAGQPAPPYFHTPTLPLPLSPALPLPAETLDLGNGVTLRLVRVPAGEFLMGDPDGEPDERPAARVRIGRPFRIGACEVTNEQFRCFDPEHDPRYYTRRHAATDDQGLPLDGPGQPAVRVSWDEAMAFCRWLSQRTGRHFTLPSEAEWEYACRAGTTTSLSYGGLDADFSPWANVGDLAFSRNVGRKGRQETGGVEHLVLEGAGMADARFDDGAVVTTTAGRYRPNAWGILDMHGSAAEWTRTSYLPYPYDPADGRDEAGAPGLKVVRGGSFYDPPRRCRSAFRLAYPRWQRVFNVGFRVVCE